MDSNPSLAPICPFRNDSCVSSQRGIPISAARPMEPRRFQVHAVLRKKFGALASMARAHTFQRTSINRTMKSLLAQKFTFHRRSHRPDFGALVNLLRPPEDLAQCHDGLSKNETEPYIELRRSEVLYRALRLWKSAGQPAGRVLEFWLQAEVELLSVWGQQRANRLLVSGDSTPCLL